MYLAHEEAGLIIGTEEWENRLSEKVWESVEKENKKRDCRPPQPNAIS